MIAALPKRASPGVDAQVRTERIRQLYGHGVTTITTSIAVAGLLLAGVWSQIPRWNALAWIAIFVTITVVRYVLLAARARFEDRLSAAQWELLFAIGAFIAGCSWGLDAVLLFPAHELDYQLFIAIFSLGLSTGAASSLSTARNAFLAFLFPTCLPLAMRFMLQPSLLSHLVGFATIVYCLALVAIGLNNAKMITTALRLRFMNLELAHELEVLATRDSLTGLPNRLILVERLATALKRADRGEHDVAIAFVDCDGFKKINDTYGHQAGDEYLRHVAQSLQKAVREVDTVARLGGDEFIVLLEKCGDKATVERIVQRILSVTTREIRIGSVVLKPRFSIGVSCYPRDGTDAEEIIQQADEAMYAAKRGGGNNVQFFIPPAPLQV